MGRSKGSKNGFRQLLEKTYETCAQVFYVEPHRAQARFCSRFCQSIAHSKELRKPQERKCRCCGMLFVVEPSNPKVYCSRKCASLEHSSKVTGPRTNTVYISIICPTCNISFTARAALQQRFCSRQCTNHSYQRRITLFCQACGQSFVVRPKLSHQKYCSRICRTVDIGKTESYIEKAFAAGLAAAGIRAQAQYGIGPYVVDFAIQELQIVIECDGDYWHSQPECIKRDRRKDTYLAARGWRVLRFSETAINTDMEQCLMRVKSVLAELQ